ncbi:MAG TPA: alpha/beta hydrolase [Acidimicrobiia bacterium]
MLGEDLEIVVRDCRLHARRWGSRAAPLIIGFPGLSGTAERFAYIGEQIGGDELQLVALDPRGRGGSETTAPGSYGWENHARDVLAVADALGVARFSMVGHSMGGSVSMKTAELYGSRLHRVVLVDVAGSVDGGVGAVIAGEIDSLRNTHASVDEYLAYVRGGGLIEPWDDYWDRVHRAEVTEVDGRVVRLASAEAVEEDRAYTGTQHPYDRWKYLTMPTLLVRATREMRPGSGFVVPIADRDRFLHEVSGATVVEVDASHLTVTRHPETARAIRSFVTAP